MQESSSSLVLAFDLPRISGVTVLVLRVRGEIDSSNAHLLDAAVRSGLQELARQDPDEPVVEHSDLVIDLREVTFISASGLSSIVAATEGGSAHHAQVRLVVDHNRPVIRPTVLTGLDEVFRLDDDLESAVNSRGRNRSVDL